MVQRTILTADKDKVLTDGTVYGKIIYLAEGETADNYHEISEEEYAEILKAEEEAMEAEVSGNS